MSDDGQVSGPGARTEDDGHLGIEKFIPLSTAELAAHVDQVTRVGEPQAAGWRPVLELMTSRPGLRTGP